MIATAVRQHRRRRPARKRAPTPPDGPGCPPAADLVPTRSSGARPRAEPRTNSCPDDGRAGRAEQDRLQVTTPEATFGPCPDTRSRGAQPVPRRPPTTVHRLRRGRPGRRPKPMRGGAQGHVPGGAWHRYAWLKEVTRG